MNANAKVQDRRWGKPDLRGEMQRESRYTVLKNKDIAKYLTDRELEQLNDLCQKIDRQRSLDEKDILQGVFVEKDWPEHDQVWAMLTQRVDAENLERKSGVRYSPKLVEALQAATESYLAAAPNTEQEPKKD